MKIIFEADFYTDGDYGFDKKRLNWLFDYSPDHPLYKNAKIEYKFDDTEDYKIFVRLQAKGDSYSCRYVLRDLLEGLICSFHTTKYWVVRDMYNLLTYFLEGIFQENNQFKTKRLSGNYDDTRVALYMEEMEA